MYKRNIIACACGCRTLMEDRDWRGRLRRYIYRHQTSNGLEKARLINLGKPTWNKSKQFSEESRLKMKKARIELWLNPEYRNKMCAIAKELNNRPEIKAMRRAVSIKCIPRGEKSWSWCGGLSFLPYNKEFNRTLKREIRDRDNHICQLCSKTEIENGKKLTVHHIDYIKEHSYKENLIALCMLCNAKVNHNREYWTSYFKDLIQNKYCQNNKVLEVA